MVLMRVRWLSRFSRLFSARARARPIRRGFAVRRGWIDNRGRAAAGRADVPATRAVGWPGGAGAAPRPPGGGPRPVRERVDGGVRATGRHKGAIVPTGWRADRRPVALDGPARRRRFPPLRTEPGRRRSPPRRRLGRTVVPPPAPLVERSLRREVPER